jgi:hypothetical protein
MNLYNGDEKIIFIYQPTFELFLIIHINKSKTTITLESLNTKIMLQSITTLLNSLPNNNLELVNIKIMLQTISTTLNSPPNNNLEEKIQNMADLIQINCLKLNQ